MICIQQLCKNFFQKYERLLEEMKRLREQVNSMKQDNTNKTAGVDNDVESNTRKVTMPAGSENLGKENDSKTGPESRQGVAGNWTGEMAERQSSKSDEKLNSRNPKEIKEKGRRGEDGYIDNDLNLRHPKNLKKKGKTGEDGFISGGKRNETSVNGNGDLSARILETSRKKVVLSQEEQEQRDKELREKQIKNHRIH